MNTTQITPPYSERELFELFLLSKQSEQELIFWGLTRN